ncbi:FKBP-type peptidyl-prolyl cis-trans isomerase [Microbacterium saperdae]|uniref:hypothetical protein n=1 Tax=Microbacterium saperdae TaxID=69368 RepID=UPI00114FF066|nr:hypothetical protein [Microbacterium saperdae]GGM50183.1 hypothetical protein GCM10010489_22030 [Microbacterium saperdae]
MRKTSAVLATLSLAVLALTGCTAAPSFDGAGCDRAAGGDGIQDAVTVTGDFGEAPKVTVFSPLSIKEPAYADLTVGDGRAIENGSQVVSLELSLYSGNTGKKVFATSYDESQRGLSTTDSWSEQSPGLGEVLQCATAGSRIVAGLTPDAFGAKSLSGIGLEDDDNVVFVIDVVDVFPSKAEGTLQFNDAAGMPTVVRAPDGTPGVIIPDTAAAPAETAVQTLIKGDGPALTADQTPVVNVTAVNWDDKSIVTTTWGTTPRLDLGTAVPEVGKALVGATVGSQLLVVVPGVDQASAIVYVVDLLGVAPAATQ